jgi:PAS domain S-box-containing protein
MPIRNPDECVIIVAPVGQDAAAIASVLNKEGLETQVCGTPAEARQRLIAGAAVLILTEEALELPQISDLMDDLRSQDPWSELPVIILTSGGESRQVRLLDIAATAAGSVTLLERPISSVTLLRSVEVALRSRRRQYQVRGLLEEQQRRERLLRESEARYRSLVKQVKDYAIFRMDNQGRPITWNEGVRSVMGFDEEEFVRGDLAEIFTPEDVRAGIPERELKEAAEVGTAGNDRWLRRKDGTRFYATGVTTRLRNEAGELTGFSKVLRDETARKLAEEALAEAQAKLKEHAANLERVVAKRTHDLQATNEQLEAFVYSIAHDLRTPLRSMIGYSQLLLDDYSGGLAETAGKLLKRIQASSEFMDKLLLDLLAYGRTARSEMVLAPVELRRAWETALFQCATQIEQLHARIDTIEPLPAVLAHEATLGQCLANLLNNALKFVEPGVEPRVRFWAEQRGDFVRVWVEDNGIGIAPSQHDRVFRVFERLNGSRYTGTGVGLSIVRKGMERMGGRVGLISDQGEGSRFWIELPKAD